MLSAVGGEIMRGIDRVIAVLLLLGAVGGAAAFARQSGIESTSRGVDLAAPPFQHVEAPGTFFIAPKLTSPAKVRPAHRVTPPHVTLQRPVQAVQAARKRVQPPAPIEAPAPVETAPPPVQAPQAPVPTPEPPRALAVVQPVPAVQPEPMKVKGKGHGHAWGHVKHDEPSPAPETPVAQTVDVPVVLPPANDSSGDEQGHDDGNDHGHGQGHDKGGGPKHSGD
jgi:hypothetical protein